MNSTIDIVWLHDDLRVTDNPLLRLEDDLPDHLVCLYVLDEAWLAPLFDDAGVLRIGPARLRFLWQCLMELRGELLQRGSDLLVRIGDPVQEVVSLAEQLQARKVRVAEHVGVEEKQHIQAVRDRLSETTEVERHESGRLIDEQALPFDLSQLPDSFSAFRRQVEKHCVIPPSLAAPVTLPAWPDAPRGFPPLNKVCAVSGGWQPDERQGLDFVGGEAAGRARLHHYVWQHHGPATYKKTRNGLLGANFSTRFSPWLAHGCISPRQVQDEVKAWESQHGSNESSYWIGFELLWREYFLRAAQLEGEALFGQAQLPATNADFDAWCNATTGVPFIDAAMLELSSTGWISNRVRQNVASFLVKDLGVDWRLGAAWFEHCLLDYDVASNWGNWRYIAGVGRDPRQDRYFNVMKQAGHYDPKGLYVAHWLPELKSLPNGLARHQPWRVAAGRFSTPRVAPEAWQRWLIDETQLEATDE